MQYNENIIECGGMYSPTQQRALLKDAHCELISANCSNSDLPLLAGQSSDSLTIGGASSNTIGDYSSKMEQSSYSCGNNNTISFYCYQEPCLHIKLDRRACCSVNKCSCVNCLVPIVSNRWDYREHACFCDLCLFRDCDRKKIGGSIPLCQCSVISYYVANEQLSPTREPTGNYFVFYENTNVCKAISKKTFSKIKGKFFMVGECKYKYVSNNKKNDRDNSIKERISTLRFKAQGLPSVSYMFNSFKDALIGFCSVGKICKFIDTKSKDLRDVMIDIVIIVMRMFDINNLSNISLICLFVDIYRLLSKISNIDSTSGFVAQGLSSIGLSALTMFLPKEIFEMFKRINTFTTSRFLDDPSYILDFLKFIIEFIKKCIVSLNFNDKVSKCIMTPFSWLEDHVDYFSFTSLYETSLSMLKNPKLAMNLVVRADFLGKYDKLMFKSNILEWLKRSNTLAAKKLEIDRCKKMLVSYDNSLRVEPSCFVFEGPPGCLKSVLMNGVIKSLGESCYYHCTKSIDDSKDWYDSYNNETIFCMDDVGQQGISQWRSIINMVSPVKLPLDCAEASLKDTKFFSSEKILVTTNSFMSLTGLCKSDCITHIDALWRRGFVFFFNTTRHLGNLMGNITLHSFDVVTNKFVVGFTNDLKVPLEKKGVNFLQALKLDDYVKQSSIPFKLGLVGTEDKQSLKIIAWMQDLIEMVTLVRREQLVSTDFGSCRDDIYSFKKFKAQSDTESYCSCDHSFDRDSSLDDELLSNIFMSSSSNTYDEDTEEDFDLDVSIPTPMPPYCRFQMQDVLHKIGERKESNNKLIEEKTSFYNRMKDYIQFLYEVSLDFLNNVISGLGIFDLFSFIVFMSQVVFVIVLTYLITMLFDPILDKIFSVKTDSVANKKFDCQAENHPSLNFIQKQVFECDFYDGVALTETKAFCLVSGHSIVSTCHTCLNDEVYVTIYKSRERNVRLFDKTKYKVVYRNSLEDVCVLRAVLNMATPFKNLNKHFKKIEGNGLCTRSFLISNTICDIETLRVPTTSKSFSTYKHINGTTLFEGKLTPTDFYYKLQKDGLCGSVLYDLNYGVLGMHVAGRKEDNLGVSKIWSDDTKERIKSLLLEDNEYIIKTDIHDMSDFSDFSGIKLTSSFPVNVPKNSHIKPTPLYGVFPVLKEPAHLTIFGDHTVKDISKKSFKPLNNLNEKEIIFGKKIISSIIEPFDKLSDFEIIKGNTYLAGLNKDSSNGFNCLKDKNLYVNFETGTFTEQFLSELKTLEDDIIAGEVDLKDMVWTECLKDEIRPLSKNRVPRSFRISRIHYQVLTKRYLGKMVEGILKNRKFHGICVGINPFIEWPDLYDRLMLCAGKVWDGDISEFDGKMLTQIQTAIIEEIELKYNGPNKKVLSFMLVCLIYCVVALSDDLYLTNHSLPSGSYITSIFGSLVNKFMKGMWYYRYSNKKKVSTFFDDVVDLVYGDDTVSGVICDGEDNLNAITMSLFFESLGLGFTDGKKNKIVDKYINIQDITFLKRSFRYNNFLDKVTCPLSLDSIFSSLSWYDSSKDLKTVLYDKIHCFQREIFLHDAIYDTCIKKLSDACVNKNISISILPKHYLLQLYEEEPEQWKVLLCSTAKFM